MIRFKKQQLSLTQAPFVLTCVGSVEGATIRFAERQGGGQEVSNPFIEMIFFLFSQI